MTSKYDRLADHLATCEGDEITLTFEEMESIVGSALPDTALYAASWWTSKRFLHVQGWRAVGWNAHADMRHDRVRFVRSGRED